jgi:energy-converting hydrogenase Eha subunit H
MELLVTLLATIPLFIGAALIVNVCRRRAARTRHPLTAMCHQSGGTMCCSCSSAMQIQKEPADRR